MANFVWVHGAWHGAGRGVKRPCCPDVMVDMPKELASELLTLS